MRCLTLLVLVGLIGTTCLAQQPTQLPTNDIVIPAQPTIPGDLTREDLLKALIKIQDVKDGLNTLKGLSRIKSYVDTENRKQDNAVQDAVEQRREQAAQDMLRQQLIDKIQDTARIELKQWVFEKWLEDRLRNRIREVIPTPQPITQYLPQPQYMPQPQYIPQPGCGSTRNLSLVVGVKARQRRFLGGVVLKPTLSIR